MDMLPLNSQGVVVNTSQEIPKEMDIFYRQIYAFIPEGKTWDDLTEEEKKIIENQFRFDPLKPGVYQGITGITSGAGGIVGT